MSLKYEPSSGSASHFCEVVVLKLRTFAGERAEGLGEQPAALAGFVGKQRESSVLTTYWSESTISS